MYCSLKMRKRISGSQRQQVNQETNNDTEAQEAMRQRFRVHSTGIRRHRCSQVGGDMSGRAYRVGAATPRAQSDHQ